MGWYLDGVRIAGAILELLHLLDELLVAVAQRIQLALLPIEYVAQFLQRTLEVGDLEFERVDPIVHGGWSCRVPLRWLLRGSLP